MSSYHSVQHMVEKSWTDRTVQTAHTITCWRTQHNDCRLFFFRWRCHLNDKQYCTTKVVVVSCLKYNDWVEWMHLSIWMTACMDRYAWQEDVLHWRCIDITATVSLTCATCSRPRRAVWLCSRYDYVLQQVTGVCGDSNLSMACPRHVYCVVYVRSRFREIALNHFHYSILRLIQITDWDKVRYHVTSAISQPADLTININVKIATIIHKSQLSSKMLSTTKRVVACYSPH